MPAFLICAHCNREHLVDDITATYAEEEPAWTLCDNCAGYCINCKAKLGEDWDILQETHCEACETLRAYHYYKYELDYENNGLLNNRKKQNDETG